MPDTDLVVQIALAEAQQTAIRKQVAALKTDLVAAESDLIAINIKLDAMRTQLREQQANQVIDNDDLRQQEIQAFRLKYPELCKDPE